jgi:transposase-like protein
VANTLGISESLLHNWKTAGNENRSQLETENARLKAHVRQLEQEREILKKP